MLAQILTIVSPISEAFPNLYISWWHPPNGNITRYNKLLWLRALCVFVVWSSIIWILYNNKRKKCFGIHHNGNILIKINGTLVQVNKDKIQTYA